MAALRLAFRLLLLMVFAFLAVLVGMMLTRDPDRALGLIFAILLYAVLRMAGWWPKAISAAW